MSNLKKTLIRVGASVLLGLLIFLAGFFRARQRYVDISSDGDSGTDGSGDTGSGGGTCGDSAGAVVIDAGSDGVADGSDTIADGAGSIDSGTGSVASGLDHIQQASDRLRAIIASLEDNDADIDGS